MRSPLKTPGERGIIGEHRGGQAEGGRLHHQLPRRLSRQLNAWPEAGAGSVDPALAPPRRELEQWIRHFIATTLFACAAARCSIAQRGRAACATDGGQSLRPNVAFSFDAKNFASRPIRSAIRGAKLSIWIDGSREKLFSRILTTDDCKFGGDGAAMPAYFPPKRPRLSTFCLRLQTRQNGPCRRPERSGDADEPESFAGRLHPQGWDRERR